VEGPRRRRDWPLVRGRIFDHFDRKLRAGNAPIDDVVRAFAGYVLIASPSLRGALACGVAALVLCGCSTILRKFHGDNGATARAEKLQILQFRVMRFADEYVGGIIEPLQRFEADTDSAVDRLAAQNWKLSQSTAAYTIATGPSAVANAFDMVVLATLSRMVVDDAWVSERFGKRAEPLREAHRRLEAHALDLVKEFATPHQLANLQRVIDEWRQRNPHIRAVSYVHFLDFAKSIGHPGPGDDTSSTGLFSLLGIDPLSNLDPAVREIAQSRELAERAIYYAQRMPNLLDMQVERMSDQFATTPETIRLLANIDRATQAADAAGRLAGELPGVLTREREAAIRQLMEALTVETAHTQALVTEIRGALEAGTATSNSINTTIRSFGQLMAGFREPKSAGGASEAPGRAFDITEYTAAATQFTRTADELQKLIAGIERDSPALIQAVDEESASLQIVVDHAYWRIVQLLVLLLLGGFVLALAYRGIARRWLANAPRQGADTTR
jgi:hypothetical protein